MNAVSISGYLEGKKNLRSAQNVKALTGIDLARMGRKNKMRKKSCADCKRDISEKWWNAKRCDSCQRKRHLSNMKKYRDSHKKEIREYQEKYYNKPKGKKENEN